MSERWPSRALVALMEYGPWLPLTLCYHHPRRWIRMLGLLWFVVWCIPAMLLGMVPLLVIMTIDVVVMAWDGD